MPRLTVQEEGQEGELLSSFRIAINVCALWPALHTLHAAGARVPRLPLLCATDPLSAYMHRPSWTS